MAGVFHTGTIVDGEWRSEAINLDTVLQKDKQKQQAAQANLPVPDQPEMFGILTQTVIESPVVRWILPVNLRPDPRDRDVAFISDFGVQVRTLGEGDQFHDLASKGFDCRIRNACVVTPTELADVGSTNSPLMRKPSSICRGGDTPTEGLWPPRLLEYILLTQEDGSLISLFVAPSDDGSVVLRAGRHNIQLPRGILDYHPGKHLAVDPSWKYLAVAGSASMFAIYTLSNVKHPTVSFDAHLEGQYFRVDGVILKMNFLFPNEDDPDHIILALLVVNHGQTRLFVHDWEAPQHPKLIRQNLSRGTVLHKDFSMPLLMIPLRIGTSLLFVYPDYMVVCDQILEGPPQFARSQITNLPASAQYVSSFSSTPLWTAWFRPLRHLSYSKAHDDLYLAREDGIILFIENSADQLIQTHMDILVDCNIDTAFACLNKLDEARDDGDRLVIGGDSCDGGLYLFEARKSPTLLNKLPNWSPTRDFVIVPHKDLNSQTNVLRNPSGVNIQNLDPPDTIFALTGRSKQGEQALSELRHGYKASIFAETNQMPNSITKAWTLSLNDDSFENCVNAAVFVLLTIASQSSLLHFDGDGSSIEDLSQTKTNLSLSSRTIDFNSFNGITIQVTEEGVSVMETSSIFGGMGDDRAWRKTFSSECRILMAATYKDQLVATVHRDEKGTYHLIVIHIGQMNLRKPLFGTISGLGKFPDMICIQKLRDDESYDILCISRLREFVESGTAVNRPVLDCFDCFKVGMNQDSLSITSNFDNHLPDPSMIELSETPCVDYSKSCTSFLLLQQDPFKKRHKISVLSPRKEPSLILVGHKDGLLIMAHCETHSNGCIKIVREPSVYTLGITSVTIQFDPDAINSAFITCDGKVWKISYSGLSLADPLLHRLWFVNSDDPYMPQPMVEQVCPSSYGLLTVARNSIVWSKVSFNPGVVPRRIALPSHPYRIQYDPRLRLLVVGMILEDGPMGILLDPESGVTRCAGHALKSQSVRWFNYVVSSVQVMQDLNEQDPRIEHTSFVFVGLRHRSLGEGYLLSFQAFKVIDGDYTCTTATLKRTDQISAMTTSSDFLVRCDGNQIRLRNRGSRADASLGLKERVFPWTLSPAVSMSVVDPWLHILTSRHSLISIDFKSESARRHRSNEDEPSMGPYNADSLDRSGLDHLVVSNDQQTKRALVLVSDKSCSVVGLITRDIGDDFVQDHQSVFEVELLSSIVRFQRGGTTRPSWDKIWETRAETAQLAYPEALGLTIDGSLLHFTILDEPTLRFLRLLQQLAGRVPQLRGCIVFRDLKPESQLRALDRSVDGDKLRIWLDRDNSSAILSECNRDELDELRSWLGYFTETSIRHDDMIQEMIGVVLGSLLRPVC